ncbi:MAG: DUF1420 family protein [Deltaproteobacteria bacterium]|nr:DUF1420 family protein [Deltaproteobacteria bacterium]
MASFRSLEYFLAPLPLPAIIAVLMVLGLQFLGNGLIKKLKIASPGPVQYAAAFILVTALVASAVHLLALAKLAYIVIMRPMALLLAALGIWQLFHMLGTISHLASRITAVAHEQDYLGKAAMGLLGVTGLGLLLVALGPPTDSDSLRYHLGVPLDILRHHGSYPRLDWLHTRLTGLGESLNLLGLAGGTDIFGAVLQFAGVLLVLFAVISLATDSRDKILLSLGVLGCPLLVFLVPNQKPMMLPIAATTIALLLIAQRFSDLDLTTILLSFGCVWFAISCKYSFLLTGSIVILIGMAGAYRSRILGRAALILISEFMILLFPLYLQNYWFYSDPISPFGERFRGHGDPIILHFAAFLGGITDESFWPAPLKYLVPDSLGTFSTVLGLGPLLSLIGLKSCRKEELARILLAGAVLAVTAILLLCQATARFLLEPFFWTIPLAALVEWKLIKIISLRLLVVQMLIMAIVVWFGVWALFPGALTMNLRNITMNRTAQDFQATRWLNKVLPSDAVVLPCDINSLALMGRPFMAEDYVFNAHLESSWDRAKVLAMLRLCKVNTIVTRFPLSSEIKRYLGPYLGKRLAGPKEFLQGKRNPWNRKEESLVVYRINADGADSIMLKPVGNNQGEP